MGASLWPFFYLFLPDVSNRRGETAASFAQQEINERKKIISEPDPASHGSELAVPGFELNGCLHPCRFAAFVPRAVILRRRSPADFYGAFTSALPRS